MLLRGHDNSNYGLQSSKKYVFKREQKTGSDGADVICCGRLFQISTAATGKARSPYVESRVRIPDGEKSLRICLVASTEYRRVPTDRRTDIDGRTSCDGIVRAMHSIPQ